ncbi:hypothetical protein GCM10007079_51590 [Nocardiopsis terrae]|nr:hypothetical protein GCM10007079_51590 [Nocardiopsis terrae]
MLLASLVPPAFLAPSPLVWLALPEPPNPWCGLCSGGGATVRPSPARRILSQQAPAPALCPCGPRSTCVWNHVL